MSALVTGEAVVLDLRLARLPSRALGLVVDLTTQVAILSVVGLAVAPALDQAEEALATAVGLVISVAILVGYPVTFETLTRGRSLGKMAMGLRVIRDDGGPIRFRHAFVRGLVGFVEFFMTFGSAALLSSLISPTGKRLGDLLAGTVVVRERMPVSTVNAVAMPPALAVWASTLDLTGLTEDIARQARDVMLRWYDLAPAVRDQTATGVADVLATTVRPAPPPGVPVWAYLAAVLAERHRRELARMGVPAPAPPRWGQAPWQPPATGWGPPPPGAWGAPPPPAPPPATAWGPPPPPPPPGPEAPPAGFQLPG